MTAAKLEKFVANEAHNYNATSLETDTAKQTVLLFLFADDVISISSNLPTIDGLKQDKATSTSTCTISRDKSSQSSAKNTPPIPEINICMDCNQDAGSDEDDHDKSTVDVNLSSSSSYDKSSSCTSSSCSTSSSSSSSSSSCCSSSQYPHHEINEKGIKSHPQENLLLLTSEKEGSLSPTDTLYHLHHLRAHEMRNTLPAIPIIFFYCIGHCCIYECVYTTLNLFMSARGDCDIFCCLTFSLGLFLSRLSGSIWDWSYMNERKYEKIYASIKQRERYFKYQQINESSQVISSNPSRSNKAVVEKCKNTISSLIYAFVKKDAQILRWFKKHKVIKGIVSSIAIYSIFISTYMFTQERVAPILTNDRQSVLDGLPSAQQYQPLEGTTVLNDDSSISQQLSENCTMVKTQTVSVIGMRLQRKMTYLMPELYAFNDFYGEDMPEVEVEDDLNSNSRYCVADHVKVKTPEEKYVEDDTYLFGILSPNSYWGFMGYHETNIVTTKSVLIFNLTISLVCIFCLKNFGVSFFDI